MIPIFNGIIVKGIFKPYNENYFIWLQKYNDKEVEITVKPKTKKRSNKQNKYFYGIALNLLSEYLGYDIEDLKYALKKHFGHIKQIEINNKIYEIPKSTRDMSTTEFEQFMTEIRRFGDEMGVYIPLPNENVQISI